jgi:CysZ protein
MSLATADARRGPQGSAGGFFLGVGEPWRALRFMVAHPSLWPYAILPFILCIVLYAGAIWAAWYFVAPWIESIFDSEAWGWEILEGALSVLFWVFVLILAAVLFVPIAALIANPFNDLLSEKTEKIYMNLSGDQPFSIRALIRALKVGLAGEIARTIKVSILLLLAMLLNFIPVIGSIAASIVTALITIKFLSLEFTSFSMDRRIYTWQQKQDFLRRFRSETFGFGAMAFGLMLIPGVNAFFIPVSAVAGTMLFCDTELRRR